jgi:hypothetical protein
MAPEVDRTMKTTEKFYPQDEILHELIINASLAAYS